MSGRGGTVSDREGGAHLPKREKFICIIESF